MRCWRRWGCREDAMTRVRTGSCLCGARAYEITGELDGVWVCHCSLCRKVSGANGNWILIVPRARLRWLRGEDHGETFALRPSYTITAARHAVHRYRRKLTTPMSTSRPVRWTSRLVRVCAPICSAPRAPIGMPMRPMCASLRNDHARASEVSAALGHQSPAISAVIRQPCFPPRSAIRR